MSPAAGWRSTCTRAGWMCEVQLRDAHALRWRASDGSLGAVGRCNVRCSKIVALGRSTSPAVLHVVAGAIRVQYVVLLNASSFVFSWRMRFPPFAFSPRADTKSSR